MWPKANHADYPRDASLIARLTAGGISSRRLAPAEHRHWEFAWRRTYQPTFARRGSLRHRAAAFARRGNFLQGAKAVNMYLSESATRWMLIPFLSSVAGTSVHVIGPTVSAFECKGPLLELGDFNNVEFFVSPPDLSWTFLSTHEDFALGGPYFARAAEIPRA